ncbi:MAG: hypothetical protein B6227_01965 [Fusobacteriia bacterium 4572_74]|nr:MAG: hypothetical protein B6227_01965 [Fusobacteriia bacterium 4572_74]
MKKITLIISLSLISYRKSINQNQLHKRNIKLKNYFKNKFKNTKVIAYCKGGKIIYKGKFKNSKKNGEWIIKRKKNLICIICWNL